MLSEFFIWEKLFFLHFMVHKLDTAATVSNPNIHFKFKLYYDQFIFWFFHTAPCSENRINNVITENLSTPALQCIFSFLPQQNIRTW